MSPGTSIFDPVLCELVYRWFCPQGGGASVLDPFAGGSVRGIVAAYLGLHYVGIELRPEQVRANEQQVAEILKEHAVKPRYVVGDSSLARELAPGEYDLIFTCPPYYDREVYSDLPGDLSNLPSYDDFLTAYRKIIAACVSMLKENRFACFVVSDIRDERGFYRGLPGDTAKAFADAGMRLYNDAVLVNTAGSLPIRAGRQFSASRKLGRSHQNVLVFYKGDPDAIKSEFGPVEVELPAEAELENQYGSQNTTLGAD